ncbi:VOC family protein [Meridianimarinicoccus sp. MJW13]|uniref:VOC family protein n=1 Tax=Meridianimarinicoccus sp. MJW13 TaxID=2720031 RepID=UPI001867D503|nr:VOC family protein [Fluviibacterium sp. MJW13]
MSFTPDHATVWIEIPVTDLGKSIAFYEAATGGKLERQQMGPNETAVFQTADPAGGVAGHLYEGKPAAQGQGPTIHLAIAGTLEEALERLRKAGGSVLSDPIPIPAGRFAYCQDLDGNSIGLFEGT